MAAEALLEDGGGGLAGRTPLTAVMTSRPFQYLQLKKKLEDEFPGRLDIVSVGTGKESNGG